MTASDAKPKLNISVRVFEPPTVPARGGLRILLLKLDHIGDFFTAIEAFRVMRQAFADAEITLICLPAVVPLAESTGLFDRVKGFTAEPDSAHLGKVPRMYVDDLAAQFCDLLEGRYFLATDFKYDASTRKWLDLVDTECRAGFAAQTEKGLDILLPQMEWDVSFAALAAKHLPIHAEMRLTLLAHAIADALHKKPLDAAMFQVPKNLGEEPAYRALKDEKRLKIGISIGAGSELRKWDAENWHALMQNLTQTRDAFFVLLGGPTDQAESKALAAKFTPSTIADLTGAMPLAELPAYMSLLDAYIGCDTGLTHLAAGLGIPTVNIFAGISNVSVWRARGPRVKTIYTEVVCAPCHLRFKKDCPNNHICMKAIHPGMVYACFEQVMADHEVSRSSV